MTEQVAVSIPHKRREKYSAEHKYKKETKKTKTDSIKTLNPKQKLSEETTEEEENMNEENINGSFEEEEDEYSVGEEEEDEEEKDVSLRSSNPASTSNITGEEEGGYSGSSEEDGDEEDGNGSDGEKTGIRFAEGSNAFRTAFAKIMEKKVPDDALGPVLSAHKKLIAKKLDEEANELKVKSEAKKEKRLMKEKGHVKPESFLDVKEKSLIKLATRGVVKLFNAVSKAHSVQNAFDVSKSKGAKAATKESKAAFLSELRGSSTSVKPGQLSSINTHSSSIREAKKGKTSAVKEPGWVALRDDFMLTSSKLKDWDKMPEAGTEDVLEEIQGRDSDNSSDED